MAKSDPQLRADLRALQEENERLRQALAARPNSADAQISQLRAEIEMLKREIEFERRKNAS